MERQNERIEIDLIDLFHYLKKRVWIIIASALIGLVCGFLFHSLFITPEYTAEARMYVLNRSNENNVGSADFQISSYVLNDYKELITGRNVTQKVIDQLGLKMSPKALGNRIRVEAPTNTRVLQIFVTDSDPQRAADIANAVYQVAAQQIQSIMAVDAVRLVYAAEVPASPSSSTSWLIARRVALAAMGLAIFVMVIIYVYDDTIRTEEDVERHLGLSIMGVIPESTDMQTGAEGVQPNRKLLAGKRVVNRR